MSKFKVGDKVKVVKVACGATGAYIGDVGIVKKVAENTSIKNGVEFEKKRNCYHTCSGSCKNGYGYWCTDGMLELVEEPKMKPIVIYHNGNEVIALDKNTGEKGIAKCNPSDRFDFYVGAQLAYDRLIKGKNDEKKEEKKLLNCKFCVTATEQPCFTVGKIYEIIDGHFRCKDGIYPLVKPIEDIDDLKDYLSGKPGSGRNGDIGWMRKTEFVVVVE